MSKQRRIHDRIVAALVKRGASVAPKQDTRKYTKLNADQPGKFWYVGKSGALRFGGSVATCQSYTGTKKYKELLASEPA